MNRGKLTYKTNHCGDNWDEHLALDLLGNSIEVLPAVSTPMYRFCYENVLIIDGKKFIDLKKLMEFLQTTGILSRPYESTGKFK